MKISEFILVICLLCTVPLFAFHPSYREEFILKNMTGEDIVIVVPEIGKYNTWRTVPYYSNDANRNILGELSINTIGYSVASDRASRIVPPGQTMFLGYCEHEIESFSKLPPYSKMDIIFPVILVFDLEGNLKHNISNFQKWDIQNINGAYSLIIDGIKSRDSLFFADDEFRSIVH